MASRQDRKTPVRMIDQYVLSYEKGAEIKWSDIDYRNFIDVSIDSSQPQNISARLKLGFSFPFQDKLYDEIVLGAGCFLVLLDPATASSFNISNVLYSTTGVSAENRNELIRIDGFTNGKHVVVAPWMTSAKLVPQTIETTSLDAFKQDLTYGKVNPKAPYFAQTFSSFRECGIKFCNLAKLAAGNRCVAIRWYMITGANRLANVEVLLHENGKIEFNYANVDHLHDNFTSFETNARNASGSFSGVIGVFASGSATAGVDRSLRDFSADIFNGSTSSIAPINHALGGFTYNSTSSHGTNGITVYHVVPNEQFWPAGGGFAKFSFFPLPKQRISLPKQERLVAERDQNKNTFFDDRKTIQYNSIASLTYPTLQNRTAFRGVPGYTQTQDIYTNTIVTTGSIKKSNSVLLSNVPSLRKPFREQTVNWSGPAQEKIELEFPIDRKTKMLESTASLYYYNPSFKSWLMPQNLLVPTSSYNPNTTTVPPRYTNPDTVTTPAEFFKYELFAEDHRGFNAIGMLVASGTQHMTNSLLRLSEADRVPTTPHLGKDVSERPLAISEKYAKTFLNNPDYYPTADEVFKLPQLKGPFLLDHAVIEFPLDAGPSWFTDQTTVFRTFDHFSGYFEDPIGSLVSQKYDLGGPALTVALMNRLGTADNFQNKVDLILSATITHNNDNTRVIEATPDAKHGILRHLGFKSFHVTPGAVISANKINNALTGAYGQSFTGSVRVEAKAAIQNGVLVANYSSQFIATLPFPSFTHLKQLTRKQIKLAGFQEEVATEGAYPNDIAHNQLILDVQPFGRAATGFTPSGRSYFGKENSTLPFDFIKNGYIDNPIYYAGAREDDLTSLPPSWVTAASSSLYGGPHAAFPLTASVLSPYLLKPEDELFISISKTRPCSYTTVVTNTSSIATSRVYFSASVNGHEVYLSTGSIKITLYGNYVQNNDLKEDKIFSPINDSAVTSIIGDDPILDQVDAPYREQFFRTFSDAVMTGSLVDTYAGVVYTGTRSRKFDSTNVLDESLFKLSIYEQADPFAYFDWRDPFFWSSTEYFTSLAGRFKGIQNNTKLISDTEQYYDSCTPNIQEIWRLNNVKTTGWDIVVFRPPSVAIALDHNATGSHWPQLSASNDKNLTWSYPFEPRYADVNRDVELRTVFKVDDKAGILDNNQSNINALTIVHSIVNNTFTNDWTAFTACDSIGTVGFNQPGNPRNISDLVKKTMSNTNKILFGFGDINTIKFDEAGTKSGTNHFLDFGSNTYTDAFAEGVVDTSTDGIAVFGPIPRGWKYGLINGSPYFSSVVFRRNRFGQLRDMLEQRLDTKFVSNKSNVQVFSSPVKVRFVDPSTKISVDPLTTLSPNVSLEATSSLPYFDGEFRNRSFANGVFTDIPTG